VFCVLRVLLIFIPFSSWTGSSVLVFDIPDAEMVQFSFGLVVEIDISVRG
jgi:hypothetical protein